MLEQLDRAVSPTGSQPPPTQMKPRPHRVLTSSELSSVRPSQSLSWPSHDSLEGPTAPSQTIAPAWQIVAPATQAPTSEPQAKPTSMRSATSSAAPSQSLSLPSQVSFWGPTEFRQTSWPPWQFWNPGLHSPVSSPHGAFCPAGSSSTHADGTDGRR